MIESWVYKIWFGILLPPRCLLVFYFQKRTASKIPCCLRDQLSGKDSTQFVQSFQPHIHVSGWRDLSMYFVSSGWRTGRVVSFAERFLSKSGRGGVELATNDGQDQACVGRIACDNFSVLISACGSRQPPTLPSASQVNKSRGNFWANINCSFGASSTQYSIEFQSIFSFIASAIIKRSEQPSTTTIQVLDSASELSSQR